MVAGRSRLVTHTRCSKRTLLLNGLPVCNMKFVCITTAAAVQAPCCNNSAKRAPRRCRAGAKVLATERIHSHTWKTARINLSVYTTFA